MDRQNDPASANSPSALIADPLKFQSSVHFPGSLEQAYRRDFADRFFIMQRHFIAFGFVLFALFGILDYYAMPRTHDTA